MPEIPNGTRLCSEIWYCALCNAPLNATIIRDIETNEDLAGGFGPHDCAKETA